MFASSSIPMPSTGAKRRAEPASASAQPPHNRMRMSIAGGAGPSRPVQQTLAPPSAYAPRASTFGASVGHTPANPLLLSARKDTGKTPLRGVPGTGRRQGFLASNWSVPKDARPVKDRQYQAMMQREILDYLVQARCVIPNLSLKTLQTPTNREFHLIFQFLITDIDPTYVFGRERKPEEEIIILLRDLRYPLVDSISKTSLAAPGSSSAWPTLLAMLHWLVTINQELPKWLDPEISQDYLLVPPDQLPLDVDIPNFPELVTCDYVFSAYNQYMYGMDEFREQDLELEGYIDRKNEAVIRRGDEAELRIANLKSKISSLKTNPSDLAVLNKEHEKYQSDLEKLNARITETDDKWKKKAELVDALGARIKDLQAEIAELNTEHEKIVMRIAEQGLSQEQVQHMNAERDKLKKMQEDLLPKVAEAAHAAGELEIAIDRRADAVDQVLTRYTTLIYNTGLAPLPPAPFQDVNFKLELNTAVSDPMEMLKGDLRGVIHPALRSIVEARSKERAEVDERRIKAMDEFEALTHQCDTLMEEAEPKENQLLVLQTKTEELRNTVAAETAAANAEAGKMERDLGQIEASVQQSEIALRSRKQRLQVEYADVLRKTEHLKEETKKKVTFECNQMLGFKQDVTKLLEDLVVFARDN